MCTMADILCLEYRLKVILPLHLYVSDDYFLGVVIEDFHRVCSSNSQGKFIEYETMIMK